jgi:MFS family permease
MRAIPPAPDTVSPRSRLPALMVLCAGMLMIILDATIVNVALPAIQTDLGFSQPNLAWVVNAYLIAFGGLLLLAGRLGDLLGRKRLFLNGLVVFTTASLFCGLANSQNVLITARFIQGAGGALASAGILGMIVTMFREPAEQAKAIGVYSFVAAAGGSIGLIAGGILTQALNWHWIFFVNLPIGIATGICASRLLPRERGSRLGDGADVVGAALITAALMLGVFTIVQSADHGWASARTMTFAAVSLVLLALFWLTFRSLPGSQSCHWVLPRP